MMNFLRPWKARRKKEPCFSRSERQTVFQFIDADEGRSVNGYHINGSSRSKYARTGNGVSGQRIETAPARPKA